MKTVALISLMAGSSHLSHDNSRIPGGARQIADRCVAEARRHVYAGDRVAVLVDFRQEVPGEGPVFLHDTGRGFHAAGLELVVRT